MTIETKYDIGDSVIVDYEDRNYTPCECGMNTIAGTSTMIEKVGIVEDISIRARTGINYSIRFKEGGSLYMYPEHRLLRKLEEL